MQHLGTCRVTQQFFVFAGGLAANQASFAAGVVGQPSRDLSARNIAHGNHITPGEIALYARHANRQQAFALIAQLGCRAHVNHHSAAHLQMIGNPLFASLVFLSLGHQQGANSLTARQA